MRKRFGELPGVQNLGETAMLVGIVGRARLYRIVLSPSSPSRGSERDFHLHRDGAFAERLHRQQPERRLADSESIGLFEGAGHPLARAVDTVLSESLMQ